MLNTLLAFALVIRQAPPNPPEGGSCKRSHRPRDNRQTSWVWEIEKYFLITRKLNFWKLKFFGKNFYAPFWARESNLNRISSSSVSREFFSGFFL